MNAAPPAVVQDFQTALAFVLGAEGGFANDALDKGGPTQYGITQRTYSDWLHRHEMNDQAVGLIRREYADAIYFEIWSNGGCGELASPLNAVHFDSCVQHGVRGAESLVKTAMWTFASAETQAFALLALRWNLYDRIVAKSPSQARFLKGWRNRLDHLRTAVGL